MKEGIHPKYQQTTITCACGNVIETGSTKKDIKVEVCSKCHPFYTGKQKMVDTGGRVSRFNKKFGLGYSLSVQGPVARDCGGSFSFLPQAGILTRQSGVLQEEHTRGKAGISLRGPLHCQ